MAKRVSWHAFKSLTANCQIIWNSISEFVTTQLTFPIVVPTSDMATTDRPAEWLGAWDLDHIGSVYKTPSHTLSFVLQSYFLFSCAERESCAETALSWNGLCQNTPTFSLVDLAISLYIPFSWQRRFGFNFCDDQNEWIKQRQGTERFTWLQRGLYIYSVYNCVAACFYKILQQSFLTSFIRDNLWPFMRKIHKHPLILLDPTISFVLFLPLICRCIHNLMDQNWVHRAPRTVYLVHCRQRTVQVHWCFVCIRTTFLKSTVCTCHYYTTSCIGLL